jgi:hypothetical protein
VIIDDPRLLKTAVRIWRQSLVLRLEPPRAVPTPQPQTQDEACEMLAEHLRAAAQATRDLIAAIAPPGHAGTLEAQVGPLGLRAVIQPQQLILGAAEWPVSYQRTEAVTVTKPPADGRGSQDTDNDLSWGRTTLGHLTRPGPQGSAVQRVRAAIEEMTVKGWLTA